MPSAPTKPLFDWLDDRAAGVLLHLTSLPSSTGIGNLGHGAYCFIDFLEASGMQVWQLCPLGPTGYGDSPYQCFSAFAGNPYLIDLEALVTADLLRPFELQPLEALDRTRVDYGELYALFWPILKLAYKRFAESGADSVLDYGSLAGFRAAQENWLEDYARFIAIKAAFDNSCWLDWPATYRDADKARTKQLSAAMREEADAQVFYQYVFYAQLAKLRHYASAKGVDILGDVPIFVALDSADVWANRDLFQLNRDGSPEAVAGVPPDYFSADGQLWGNPLFDWDKHRADGFRWWVHRVRSNLEFYDIVRLDHFRGFESYWAVPAGETTAINGRWVAGPGLELFEAVRAACPEAKLVAEDLGVITDSVEALREATGLPGMAVLQFAFGGGADNAYLPHNYKRNTVAYSGTHDNDTSIGWYQGVDDKTRDHVRRYLSVSGDAISWDLVRAALRSSARMAIVPLQDLMSLGPEARLNSPGAAEGNWQWRFTEDQLDRLRDESAAYLREQNALFGRI